MPTHAPIEAGGRLRSLPGILLGFLLLLGAAAGCQPLPEVRMPTAEYPETLSAWGLLERRGDTLVLGRDVVPYEVATPLFSDYALKLRTYYLPPGTSMDYSAGSAFRFPVGSVLSKTFFYPAGADATVRAVDGWNGDVAALDLSGYRLIETRLLIRREAGWDALPYVWSGDDAHLRLTGAVLPLRLAGPAGAISDLPYVVPARSECAGCHATNHSDGRILPIGIKARHLNYPYPGHSAAQLDEWAARGQLSGLPGERPRSVVWNSPDFDLEARARAYLDSNCGHCHNPAGAADTSGLLLDAHTTSLRALGFCKSPVAAGRGTGGRPYSIVPGEPDRSILIFRMETGDPATRMPEVGRAVRHREGVELLRRWVASLPGECV